MLKRILAVFSAILVFSPLAYAAGGANGLGDFSTWLYNIDAQIPHLRMLIVAIGFVSGIGFVIGAIMKLKHVAQSQSSMMQREGISGPLVHFLIGVVLIYFAGFVNISTETLFGTDSPMGYQAIAGGTFDAYITPIIDLTKLIGMIAFIKGLYILAKLGQQAQAGTLSKGLVHLIGGVLAMNIEATYTVLLNTLQGL